MGFDDEFLDLKHAIRTYGPIMVHGRYVRKREDALDRGDQDEADHWEVRRQSVGMYIDRRRFRYNVFSFSVGAVLALLPTGYVWIELQLFIYAIPTFLIFTVILYLAVRFITNFYMARLVLSVGKYMFGCGKLTGQGLVSGMRLSGSD
jgi:hypothetical protein